MSKISMINDTCCRLLWAALYDYKSA